MFFSPDGKAYLSTTSGIKDPSVPKVGLALGIYISEIDLETGRTLTRPKLIKTSSHGNGIAEGSHIFIKGDYHYLVTAEGGTFEGHQEWVCRSKEGPLGPWEEGPLDTVNPMVFAWNHPEIRRTGHMDLVDTPDGQWWCVFLASRDHLAGGGFVESQLGRETFLAPVEWVDGWPIVNERKPITVNMESKAELQRLEESFSWSDNFRSKSRHDTFIVSLVTGR